MDSAFGNSDHIEDQVQMLKSSWRLAGTFGVWMIFAAAAVYAADKIDWKPIPDAVLQIDGHPAKLWNLYRPGKKSDPLLLQLGARMLVIYVGNQAVYEIKPELFEHKGEDLLWREADRPEKPLATSDWNTKDIGSAWRVQVKLATEGRLLDIQIPQVPDLRRGIY